NISKLQMHRCQNVLNQHWRLLKDKLCSIHY
ncbi:uncharacterized protein METZ01_LOCUS215860, partial [marine metagenome]